MVNGVSMTQLKMIVLSLAASVGRVAALNVKPDDVVLKVPMQGGFGSFSFHVAGSDTKLERNEMQQFGVFQDQKLLGSRNLPPFQDEVSTVSVML